MDLYRVETCTWEMRLHDKSSYVIQSCDLIHRFNVIDETAHFYCVALAMAIRHDLAPYRRYNLGVSLIDGVPQPIPIITYATFDITQGPAREELNTCVEDLYTALQDFALLARLPTKIPAAPVKRIQQLTVEEFSLTYYMRQLLKYDPLRAQLEKIEGIDALPADVWAKW